MGQEIERKFLVAGTAWQAGAEGKSYRQGYLSLDPERIVRVRTAGQQGYLTIKGRQQGATRAEYEYPIPWLDAQEMLDTLCHQPLIEKTRYKLEQADLTWEIDVFAGVNAGLILAEVELSDEAQRVSLPGWVGEEVTADPRYTNAYLVQHPYVTWSEPQK